ncbi:magnesium transporter [Thermohalobacter berrensis]|uniref:Magnesium transporter MgtE n=1 Tax=Thermohalobacter berrensis TaxID=99594 RepID=A0A419T178_9FIRM|nr:magnesium transporter [Thermohalobacter berrensis]RKD31330.1 magnesium transporter [Thermohalobacter berrensis]
MNRRVVELIEDKKYREAKEEVKKLIPADVPELLEELDQNSYLILFRMLPKDTAAEAFSHLNQEQRWYIINSITEKELKIILDELFFDDMIDLLEEMPANMVKNILKNTKEEERKLINQFLNYPEDSAGSLMTIEYVDLKKEMTVKEALEYIKKTGLTKETVYTCYVTDANRKLEGIVSLRKLVTSDENLTVEEIMDREVIYGHTHDDQETIAHLFKKYDFMAIPVVDKEGRLTGIITIDDIVDVIEQENTEDFQKIAAMAPSEEEYLGTGVLTLAKHRLTWLLVLMISATFTGNIIERYDSILQSVVILAAFIPMLMGTAGNAGAQSSVLIIRGLALGNIKIKDIFKVIWKELRVSSLVGLILAFVNLLRVYYLENVEFKIALTVSLTLFTTIVAAKIFGCILPIIAKKLKLDPAIMASPLITTIVDALTLIVYFTLASFIIGL